MCPAHCMASAEGSTQRRSNRFRHRRLGAAQAKAAKSSLVYFAYILGVSFPCGCGGVRCCHSWKAGRSDALMTGQGRQRNTCIDCSKIHLLIAQLPYQHAEKMIGANGPQRRDTLISSRPRTHAPLHWIELKWPLAPIREDAPSCLEQTSV